MKMNKDNFNNFKKDFMEAVKVLEDKYDVSISFGNNISYTENFFRTKIEVTNGSNAEDAEKVTFERNILGNKYGITPNDYGKEFAIKGEKFTLIGFRPRARINCFLIRDQKGTQYTCSASALGLR